MLQSAFIVCILRGVLHGFNWMLYLEQEERPGGHTAS